MRYKAPCISHVVRVLIIGLIFHTEVPVGDGNIVNIFLFHNISLTAGLKAALESQRWYTVLGNNVLTIYGDTDSLHQHFQISLIVGIK